MRSTVATASEKRLIVMTGPSHGAILRVETASASGEFARRIATTVILPSTDKVDIKGRAVFADPKRSTRSGSFIADGGVEGKVCVCDTYDIHDVERALSYAKREGALALIATEKPKQGVNIPTILISRDQLRLIKDDLRESVVSVSYTSGSYESLSVTFVLQNPRSDKDALEWDGKIRVPANTADHLHLKLGLLSEALLLRNWRGNIAEFLNKDDMAGNICLVGDSTSDRDFKEIAGLAAQYGATALFTTYKEPLRDIPLPVVVVGREFFNELKKPDVMVSFKYKSDAQRTASEPESKAKSSPKSYASALTGNASESSSKKTALPQPKPGKSWTERFFGTIQSLVKYTPQSNSMFKAIVANGTSWSRDVHLYHEATELLVWIRSVKNVQDRLLELESLNKAIGDMINDHSGAGDVMIVAFCAKLHDLLSHEHQAPLQRLLMENTVKLIENIKIDESVSISSIVDTADLDQYVTDLVDYLSSLPRNKGNMIGFVLNALWIRVHHCQSLKNGRWDGLHEISTLMLFKDEQKTLLSFMSSFQFNTLAICAATSFRDICAFFCGEHEISVLRLAFDGLLQLYQSNKTNRNEWQREFGSIREVTAITLLDRLKEETGYHDIHILKKFMNLIVQHIERDPSRAFTDFGCVYDCLRVDSTLGDYVMELMMKSICSSLEDRRGVPSPTSVSELLKMNIGRHLLLLDRKGFTALKSCFERWFLIKRHRGQEKEILILLGRISSSFFNSECCTDEEAVTMILETIRTCINTSQNCFELCLTAIDVSQNVQDIFHDGDNSNLPSSIGKIFIRETGICSTIRSSPSLLSKVTSRFQSMPDGRLSSFLYQELVLGLKDECTNIVNAMSFYEAFCKGDNGHFALQNIVYDVLINSFGNWNPSNLIDLLNFEAPLLKTIHHVLFTITTEECGEKINKKKGSDCLGILCAVADKWREKFEKDRLSMMELQLARSVLTDAKQEVLTNVVGTHFPSPSDIDEKFAEMKNSIEIIRSSLTFSVTKDDDTFTLSISDLATHYRIKIESPLSHLISKYLSYVDPDVDLGSIRRDSKYILEFVRANEKQLQAASHFRYFRSSLFQNEVGVWTEIHFEDFFARVLASLRHLEYLLSPAATFSSASVAASVLDRANVGFDDEMTAIITFLRLVDDDQTRLELKDVITMAKVAKKLNSFVECCKTFKFAFAENDDSFSELETICNQLDSYEGGGWDVDQCLRTAKRIVEILMPPPSSLSADLSERLEYYLPLFEFFDALRHCSSILDLAREQSWFGTKGLATFYKEYENVTNSFNQKQSFEMAVLDRLEPTIQCISVLGGNLPCDRVAALLQILDSKKSDFSHQSISAMRQVQENICKIQDWLSEGMDDMAAILGKLAQIQSTGRIIISSKDSTDDATPPKREMSLHYSRADGSNVIMNESEVRELVQYLRFTTHECDESRISAERFVRVYEQCGNVMASQQEMADFGFGVNYATKRLELMLGDNSEDLALEWRNKSDKKIDECKGWLNQVRSSNRHSLLFWMKELMFIFQCMCGLRSGDGDESSVEWQMLVNILSQMPLDPNLSNLIGQFADEASSGRSWLERVSIFVSECGDQGHPTSSHGSKSIIIHKMDCLDNTVFAAQLQIMQYIYKVRMMMMHYCTPFSYIVLLLTSLCCRPDPMPSIF